MKIKTIGFTINNGGALAMQQTQTDGNVTVERLWTDENYSYTIPAGDMVMLLNLYKYVKDGDIQDDFINPNGKNGRK
jgi:hypothetical protein